MQRGYLTLLAVYAPKEGKTEQTEEFYETLQDHIDKISKKDYIVVVGDYNAKVGNIPIDGIFGTNGEITTNSNGHNLKEFASISELKITNTFSRHKEIHKMMWSARGCRCIIDYILTNKKLSPLVNYTNVFGGYDVTTDHYLLIFKIRLPQKWHTFTKISLRQEEIFRVHLLEDQSIKLLYQRRLEQNLMHSPCNLNTDVEWQTLKNTLQQAANEAPGKRKKGRHKRRLILWNEDIKNLIENKKTAYLRYLTTRSETGKLEYKRLGAILKRKTRKIK